jgi:DNA-binding Lrp family transcriptional regulator
VVVPTDALVRPAVDEDAGCVGDGADDDAARWRLYVGGQRRYQGMIVAAGKQPVVRIGVESVPDIAQRIGRVQRGPIDVDPHAAGLGNVSKILDQPVAHVAHGGGSSGCEYRAESVRRLGPAVGLDKHARRPEPARQHGETRGRPTDATAKDHTVAGTSAGAGHGRIALQITERRDAQHHHVGARHVTASNGCGDDETFVAQTVDEVKSPLHWQVGWRSEADEECGWCRTHGDDVRQVCGCCPTSDVVRGRPIPPEVAILDEEVGGGDHPAVSCAQDGGVVAGTENHRVAAGQPSRNGRDQPELAELADAAGGRFHGGPASRIGLAIGRIRATGRDTVWPRRSPEPRGRRTNVVVQAYILIQTEVGKAASVAREIADIKGVTLAEDVTGPYDVIVRAEARNMDELGKLVVAKVQGVDGITRTLTCPVVHL